MIKPLDEKPEYYSIEKIGSGSATSKKKQGDVYETANAVQQRKEITTAILKSLAVLRGGAKQERFGTDVAPKILIIAGLTTGNPIFNTLFEDDNNGTNRGKTVSIDVEALRQIVDDYADRIVTPVLIGIRAGFLKNEDKVKELHDTEIEGVKLIVMTPIKASEKMSELLPGQVTPGA